MESRFGVEWRVRTRTLSTADHTLIMGILNVTPDSFSDGGRFPDGAAGIGAAIAAGKQLARDGADIVDVGGESTRPGSEAVPPSEESARVLPVVEALASAGIVVSIDTSKPEVAAAAMAAGAEIVNDVTALGDAQMADVCAETGAGVVLMHMQGTPRTMQQNPSYRDVVAEVGAFLRTRADAAREAGVAGSRICLDPGIGFGKTTVHNLELLAGLEHLVAFGHPVLVGASRKRFLGSILEDCGYPVDAADRDTATGATTVRAIDAGAAVVRAHDVRSAVEVARIADAMVRMRVPNNEWTE